MVRPAGFEPATPWFEAKYSNPLSYGRILAVYHMARYNKVMDIRRNISLRNLTTMKLGGNAAQMVEIYSADDARQAINYARQNNLRWYVLGGGSNTIAHDEDFDGLIILNKIPGFEILEQTAHAVTIRVGAGEIWDAVVARTVEMNLTGIECLSAIPGTAGAAPVQNIGAYGQEVGAVIVSVDAYDSQTDDFVQISNVACEFAYRHSIFRGKEAGRYVINSVILRLTTDPPKPPFYGAIERYLDENNLQNPTAKDLRRAVTEIRADKLPDPNIKPNTGSFFKNAIVERAVSDSLVADYPEIPHYEMPHNRVKIPTGWLIEQAGLKGTSHHGMRVHDKNALVLINESATSYHDLAAARQEIIDAVHAKFGIIIEQEPLELA